MKTAVQLQDTFLNAVRRDRMGLTVFLTNGFQLRGTVRGFDSFTIILESDGKQQLIYKHAISTMIPQRNLPLDEVRKE